MAPTRALLAASLLAITWSQQQPYVPSTDQLVVELFVRDLDRSIDFYVDLGFTLVRKDAEFAELTWEGHFFFLDASLPVPDVDTPAANVRIMVPDVDRYWEKALAAKARVTRPIDDRYYGLRDFTIVDPDGFGVRFATRLAGR